VRYVATRGVGGPEVLFVDETTSPQPAAGELLVAVEAAGVSRADVMQRQGAYPPPAGASPILGLEVAGSIAALGDGVTEWRIGDRVCALCNGGGYAECVAVPAGQTLPIPQNWSAIEAASLPENAFTVYDNVVARARLSAGETILVHGGTSGIGTMAIMFARALGARVFATAGSDAKCEASKRFGAEAAVNYRTADFVEEINRLTQGRGVDVVLDIVGGDYLPRDLRVLALDGRIACIATSRGRAAEIDLGRMLSRRATITGSSLRPRSTEQKAAIARALAARIWPLLPKRDPIAPVIDSIYSFDRAAAAHARLESSAHIGKIVLAP
jgi:NADPH:quinone reductase